MISPGPAIRRVAEDVGDMRDAYSIDVDRILHSRAYTSYIDKTQVFSLVGHQAIAHRVIHVQLLSRIARTIGVRLDLDIDLIEAIAIGHDIGHPPFGHEGERYLDKLCIESEIGRFRHNLQAIQALERIEKQGRGLNLTLPVLDGILCHNGETTEQAVSPEPAASFDDLQQKMRVVSDGGAPPAMTMEGCLVRVVDTVSYIGRDIEDSITLGIIKRDELPDEAVRILGNTNGQIVYALVDDLVANSTENTIAYSDRIFGALKALKEFNYRKIYLDPQVKAESSKIGGMYNLMFERLTGDVLEHRTDSPIFCEFLDQIEPAYLAEFDAAQKTRDFLSALTDSNFLRIFHQLFLPAMHS